MHERLRAARLLGDDRRRLLQRLRDGPCWCIADDGSERTDGRVHPNGLDADALDAKREERAVDALGLDADRAHRLALARPVAGGPAGAIPQALQ